MKKLKSFVVTLALCVSWSFLITMVVQAGQPGTDRRSYCAFTREAQAVINIWLYQRGLALYFTRENVTVVTRSHPGAIGTLRDVDTIIMKVPSAVWYTYRNRLLRNSACTIITQALEGAFLGAFSGFAGAGAVKWPDFSLKDALHGAIAGAITLGTCSTVQGVDNVIQKGDIRCIDCEEPRRSRTSRDMSDMVTLSLMGLMPALCVRDRPDCMRVATAEDSDRLFLAYTDTMLRRRTTDYSGRENTVGQE